VGLIRCHQFAIAYEAAFAEALQRLAHTGVRLIVATSSCDGLDDDTLRSLCRQAAAVGILLCQCDAYSTERLCAATQCVPIASLAALLRGHDTASVAIGGFRSGVLAGQPAVVVQSGSFVHLVLRGTSLEQTRGHTAVLRQCLQLVRAMMRVCDVRFLVLCSYSLRFW
jgi:hypothetical protein